MEAEAAWEQKIIPVMIEEIRDPRSPLRPEAEISVSGENSAVKLLQVRSFRSSRGRLSSFPEVGVLIRDLFAKRTDRTDRSSQRALRERERERERELAVRESGGREEI